MQPDPTIPPPDRRPRKPVIAVPAGAWDCHVHIFGPQDRFPLAARRTYTPPVSDVADFEAMLATVGVERAVIVQPSVYGTDNACTLDAVRRSQGRWRGVAVIDGATPDSALAEMNEAGFKGIRLNVATFQDATVLATLEHQAARLLEFGWHLQIFCESHYLPELFPRLDRIRNDIVIDHMGFVRDGSGPADKGFQALLARLREGRCWVKLSGAYRISRQGPPYDDVRPIAEALLAANPDRLVYGTDWPHPWAPDMTGPMPNDGDLMDQFAALVPDGGLRRRILVENPLRLYG